MAARTLSLEELKAMKGQEIGVSDWHPVTQEDIDTIFRSAHDKTPIQALVNAWLTADNKIGRAVVMRATDKPL